MLIIDAIASEEEITQFCELNSIEEIKSVFSFDKPTILVLNRDLGAGEYCDWKFGANSGDYMKYWCSIENVVTINVYPRNSGLFPGILAKTWFPSFGDEEMKSMRSNCSYFDTRLDTDNDTKFMNQIQNGSMFRIYSNPNEAFPLLNNTLIQVWFRIILAGLYLTVGAMGCRFLYLRWLNGSLNKTQMEVLSTNMFVCLLLGIRESMGSMELTSNLSRGFNYFFYAMLIGCGFSCDVHLSLMYSKVAGSTGFKMRMKSYSKLHKIGYFVMIMDLFTGFSIVYGSQGLRFALSTFFSMFVVFAQAGISSFQLYQTSTVIHSLEESNKAESNSVLRLLEKKLRTCVFISVISTGVFILCLVYHSMFGFPYHSAQEKLIYWSIIHMSRIGVCFAQTYSCSPVVVNKTKIYANVKGKHSAYDNSSWNPTRPHSTS